MSQILASANTYTTQRGNTAKPTLQRVAPRQTSVGWHESPPNTERFEPVHNVSHVCTCVSATTLIASIASCTNAQAYNYQTRQPLFDCPSNSYNSMLLFLMRIQGSSAVLLKKTRWQLGFFQHTREGKP